MTAEQRGPFSICFLSSVQYAQPLDPNERKEVPGPE